MVAWPEKHLSPLSSGDLPWTTTSGHNEDPLCDPTLMAPQRRQVGQVLAEFPGLFFTMPGCTEGIRHIIDMPMGQVSRTALRLTRKYGAC